MPIKSVQILPRVHRFAWAAIFALLLVSPASVLGEEAEPSSANPTVAEASPNSPADRLGNTDNTSDANDAGDAKAADRPETDSAESVEPEAAVSNAAPGAGTSSPVPDPSPPSPAPVDKSWAHRILTLSEQIDMGMSQPEDADALYHELAAILWAYQDDVYQSLRARSPDALDQRTELTALYADRVQLLKLVTPALHQKLMGGGPEGMRELQREFANAKLALAFQTLAIPRGLRRIASSVRESPLDDLWRAFKLFFGILVFRTWRRWAKTGLTDLRQYVLSIQPRTDIHLHTARLLWYLEGFRGPLEWLGLVSFASAIFEPGDLEEVATLVWTIILWTLLTRFGLLLIDALAARSRTGTRSRQSTIRLRSLRLVAAWILTTGLGLDLAQRYVGEAAIHTWAIRVFMLFLVPVGILLLHWWRVDIIRRLKEDASFSPTARRMGKREKGFGSYVNAATGVFYILGADLVKLTIRVASQFEGGRKIVATLLRREVERGTQQQDLSEKPISEELLLKLLTPDGSIMAGPFRDGIDRITEFARSGQGASVAVLGERGGGVSTFLRLLQSELGEIMRIIDCPPGKPGTLGEAISKEFGLGVDADLHAELRPRLDATGVRVIAIDNYHRVARPQMGGLEGMKLAAGISQAVGEDILWIVTFTRASWPYINRLLGDQAILQEVIELPAWSETELGELFDARCKNADIEPNYRQLVFPRQFEDGERDTLEQRNRVSFRRILWELSDGNPEVAIRLFADSLRERLNGEIIVRLPQPGSQSRIASANRTTMLIFKVLIETEMATLEDLEASIREPREMLSNALAHCRQQGWVEIVYDQYQITWAAYRPVKRVLVRRGLIAR